MTADEAGQAFSAMLDDSLTVIEREEPEREAPPVEKPAEPNEQEEGADPPLSEAEGSELVTVEVDGKTIQLTKAQIAEAHKSGLRQADYTKKTTELAESRKTAEAETARAREERGKYAEGLQQAESLLSAQLQQQQNIDWQRLLDTDPVEYLKQQHLAQTRQAQLQQVTQQKQMLQSQGQAEHQTALAAHIEDQRSELIAKIPEWKDAAVMKAEATELRDYLKTQGLSDQEIYSVTDHRAIIQSRKAMLFDKMIAKASVATKRVQNTPQRVERPQGGESQAVDKRGAAFQRLSKTGSVDAAGSIFANMFS
jgi:hypothetical protein